MSGQGLGPEGVRELRAEVDRWKRAFVGAGERLAETRVKLLETRASFLVVDMERARYRAALEQVAAVCMDSDHGDECAVWWPYRDAPADCTCMRGRVLRAIQDGEVI